MKNPLRNLAIVLRTWRSLKRYPGLFTWADAALQLERVVWLDRFHYRAAGVALRREAQIEDLGDNLFRVRLARHGLLFYWQGRPTDNLWYLIEQEFDTRNPHCYTTPPIQLGLDSLVLDVGACEGLFAFRVAKAGLARRVICFEPSRALAELIRRGAADNGVGPQVAAETLAVDKVSGWVSFQSDDDAQTGKIQAGGAPGARVEAVSLDDYCGRHRIALSPRDLIKIDAEGADFDVLRGAESVIRAGSPQIAVTTYHTDRHCFEIVDWLRQVQPRYRLRLKGFASWTPRPRPVLLQAAL